MNHAQTMECRHGVAVGPSSISDIMPRPDEGRHARLSMRVRRGGDRWVLMIKDQTGPGRHRAPRHARSHDRVLPGIVVLADRQGFYVGAANSGKHRGE